MKVLSQIRSLSKINPVHLTGLCGVIILTLAFYFAIARPAAMREQRSASQQAKAAHDREHLAVLRVSIQSLTASLEHASKLVTSEHVLIRTQSDLNSRLADLASAASACHLVVSDMTPGDPSLSGHLVEVPLQMIGSGTYRDCLLLLQQLHEEFPDITVCGFKLAAGPNNNTSCSSFMLLLRWIAQADESAPPRRQPIADVR